MQIQSPHALLMDAKTGQVIYSKRGEERLYPASTTKVLACIVAIKHLESLDQEVVASRAALMRTSMAKKELTHFTEPAHLLEYDGVMIRLRPGEKMSYYDLLCGLMVKSANDAANVLAENIAGSIDLFIEMMNEEAKAIGCKDSLFQNAHGLHHPMHYSTPYDIALIFREAMSFPLARELMSMTEWFRPTSKQQKGYRITPKNPLMLEGKFYYPYAQAGKTGGHKRAGYNLVAYADNGERQLISAVMKSENWNQCFSDTIQLFEAFFQEEKIKRILFSSKDPFFSKEIIPSKKLKVGFLEDVVIEYFPSEERPWKTEIEWIRAKKSIKEGQKVGRLNILTEQKQVLESFDIYSLENAKGKTHSVKKYLIGFFVLVFFFSTWRRQRRKE